MTLTDEMKADGWIEHDGRSIPDRLPAVIDVQRRSGQIITGQSIFSMNWLDWTGESVFECCKITAYRPYKPEQPQ